MRRIDDGSQRALLLNRARKIDEYGMMGRFRFLIFIVFNISFVDSLHLPGLQWLLVLLPPQYLASENPNQLFLWSPSPGRRIP